MRIFRNVDDGYLNSECLYKAKRLGAHLAYFKSHTGLKFDGIVELCATVGLKHCLEHYTAPHVSRQPLPLTGLNRIDAQFNDYDLLMAYVFDGGKLEHLFDLNSGNTDVPGLIHHLLSTAPQTFIIKSGLRPGELTNLMYVRFVNEVIECFPDEITKLLNATEPKERDRLYINLVGISACSGAVSLDYLRIKNPPSNKSVCRLAGLVSDGQMPSMYLCELRAHCDSNFGTKELASLLSCTFMTEAFRRSMESTKPEAILVDLRNRALAWSMLLKCPPAKAGDFVEQLMVSALSTSPKLFEIAGFCNKNMIGRNVNYHLTGLVKTISDGPFSKFIKPDYDMNQTLNCLEFLHELDHDFFLNDIYDDSGFRHSNSIKILTSIGGHCPGAEYAILNSTVEPEHVLALLRMLSALDCYDKYTEDSLVTLMSYYVDRLPMAGQDNIQQPLAILEMTSDMRERARLEFERAYETNPGFKQKFIEKVESMEGLTHEHLRLFSLSGMDLPKTMARTSRKDRGYLLEDELGL